MLKEGGNFVVWILRGYTKRDELTTFTQMGLFMDRANASCLVYILYVLTYYTACGTRYRCVYCSTSLRIADSNNLQRDKCHAHETVHRERKQSKRMQTIEAM
jgi:hypothetical protein